MQQGHVIVDHSSNLSNTRHANQYQYTQNSVSLKDFKFGQNKTENKMGHEKDATMVHFPCVWYRHMGFQRERVVVSGDGVLSEVEREAETVRECIGGREGEGVHWCNVRGEREEEESNGLRWEKSLDKEEALRSAIITFHSAQTQSSLFIIFIRCTCCPYFFFFLQKEKNDIIANPIQLLFSFTKCVILQVLFG